MDRQLEYATEEYADALSLYGTGLNTSKKTKRPIFSKNVERWVISDP